MRNSCFQLARVALISCAAAIAIPGTATSQEVPRDFTSEVQAIFEEGGAPGMAMAIVHEGREAYAEAFGVRSIETDEAMTTDLLFHWASVTKPFVATAIVQLVEAGKIDLEASVTSYLPYFKMADDRYRAITIRQLLTHTSGMPDVSNYEWHNPVYDDGALERYVRSISHLELIAAPGERMQYSNIAFEMLGDVIAKTSGVSFEACVDAHILTPLGMDESTLLKVEARDELLVAPHAATSRGPRLRQHWPYNRMHAPSSCMISNVHEMARWAMANLNHGRLEDARILKETSYDLLWKPGSPVTNEVGLSWFLGKMQRLQTVSHGGGDQGFRTHVLLVPEHDFGIVIAFNGENAPKDAILQLALRRWLTSRP